MIEPISFYSRKRISIQGGDVLHFIRSNDKNFSSFGEVYFSFINYNSIKGWKCHNSMTMNLTCIFGEVQFIFAHKEHEEEWIFSEYILSPKNNGVLYVPPGYFFAFKGLIKPYSIVSNLSNIVHNELEVSRLSIDSIPYAWP